MVVAALLTYVLDTARQSFDLLLSIGAGTGLLYLLRWFWWRINAWSEIAAMVQLVRDRRRASRSRRSMGWRSRRPIALLDVGGASRRWCGSRWPTSVRAPTAPRCSRFYRLVRPGGPGWRDMRARGGRGGRARLDSAGACSAGCSVSRSCTARCSAWDHSCSASRRLPACGGCSHVASGLGLLRVVPRLWSGAPIR